MSLAALPDARADDDSDDGDGDGDARWDDIQRRADSFAETLRALGHDAAEEDDRGRVTDVLNSLQAVRTAVNEQRARPAQAPARPRWSAAACSRSTSPCRNSARRRTGASADRPARGDRGVPGLSARPRSVTVGPLPEAEEEWPCGTRSAPTPVSAHGRDHDLSRRRRRRDPRLRGQPGTATGPVPGIVVVHHMPGWDEFYQEFGERLARHGYMVICPDLYCRFGHGTPDDVAAKVRAEGGVHDDSVVADCAAALAWLKAPARSTTARSASSAPARAAGTAAGGVAGPRLRRGRRPVGRRRGHGSRAAHPGPAGGPDRLHRRSRRPPCSGCSATTTRTRRPSRSTSTRRS